MNNFTRLFLGATAIASAIDANAGILRGSVIDKKTGEPIIGATITVAGTNIGAITDYEGNYEINVPDGEEYEIEVRYVSYKNLVLENIKVKGETVNNIELEEESVVLGGIEVVASLNRESENYLLLEQKKSVLSRQAVGAKELSRKGVSDAEGAVQKISGISKQEGVKNVFVRGLGDRYNTTMLNGFPIPSEDPEYKNISLSFFDTDVIQSVGVNKVFSASGAGDAAGALIDIQSKELIGQDLLEVGGSFGVNTQTVNQPFMLQDGTNYLGISNNTQPGNNYETVYGFKNSLDPSQASFNPDHSYSIAAGNKFYLGENLNPLNILILANYSQSNSFTDETIRNTTTDGTIYQDQTGKKYERDISQMVLGNVSYMMRNNSEIAYNLMMIHSNSQYVADITGMDSDMFQSSDRYMGFLRRQQANDNLLVVNQFLSKWTLSDKWEINAGAAYNYVSGDEPDRRMNYFTETSTAGIYTPSGGTGSHLRYFSTLKEHDANLKAEAVLNLPDRYDNNSNLTFGYTGRIVNDNFEAIEYDFNSPGGTTDLGNLKTDNFFNQNNLNAGKFRIDKNLDIYRVNKYINSLYADATYRLTRTLTGNIGLRMDYVNMGIDYDVNDGGDKGREDINKPFILPSLNLKYDPAERHSIRLGLSKTYTLPQNKEISPFRYVSINFKSQGNQDLKPNDNYNADLKWDFYPSASELISIGAFYKLIKNPISRIEIASAGGYLSYENISRAATVAGVEFELRKDIFKHTAALSSHKINFGLNGAYTYTMAKSDMATDKSGTALEGAAPFIGNADITYRYTRADFNLNGTVVCSYFSDRIYTIGTQGYKDIIEKGVPTLDIVLDGQINKHLSIDLKIKNLLNPSYRLFREASGENGRKIILSDYTKGRKISIGLTYRF